MSYRSECTTTKTEAKTEAKTAEDFNVDLKEAQLQQDTAEQLAAVQKGFPPPGQPAGDLIEFDRTKAAAFVGGRRRKSRKNRRRTVRRRRRRSRRRVSNRT